MGSGKKIKKATPKKGPSAKRSEARSKATKKVRFAVEEEHLKTDVRPAAKREGVVMAAEQGPSEAAPETEPKNPRRTPAVELSFLPPQFTEPQLVQFLSQFGSAVTHCVCLRQKKTLRSRGIALVQFDDPSVIPHIVEECNGMFLGGNTVRARRTTLRRALPPLHKAILRNRADLIRRAQGAPLIPRRIRFAPVEEAPPQQQQQQSNEPATSSSSLRSIVGALKKYTAKERQKNKQLAAMGVSYEFHGFENQWARLRKDLILSKTVLLAKAEEKRKAARKNVPEATTAQPTHKRKKMGIAAARHE